VHPDTGNVIEGFRIPMWAEVVELLERGQRSLPDLRTLGWDIAVTDDGPLIVETNATYDIDIVQVAYQRGVRSDIEEVFGPIG
jgi:glutathione synthase/RimK-type ligase-like ATP-grasp enzyme